MQTVAVCNGRACSGQPLYYDTLCNVDTIPLMGRGGGDTVEPPDWKALDGKFRSLSAPTAVSRSADCLKGDGQRSHTKQCGDGALADQKAEGAVHCKRASVYLLQHRLLFHPRGKGGRVTSRGGLPIISEKN